jgi:hypothetical protein
MYRSPDLGFRNDIYKQDVLHSQSIFSFKSKTAYHVYLNDKVCIRDSLGSEAVVLLQQNTVLSTVQRLRGREHISLGISEIEGTVVTGIEIVDTVLSDRGTTIGNIRVYVDVDTQWPVLIEGEGVITKREGVTNHRLTRTRYQWQPQLTPEDFTPDIPEDFFVADTNEPIDHIIERAIRGLRNFALMTGRYPEHPDFGTLRRDVATELEKLEQTGAYSPEIADSLDVVLYAGVLFNWHDGVRRYNEAGEFKYYDSSVTPSDTGKVLYRWRMDDKIGIIYGDLRFGTGDASEFAEFDRERYKLDDQERRIGPFDPSQ